MKPRLVFMGSPDLARVSLEAMVAAGRTPRLVISQPDRPSGRGRKLTPCPVAAYARQQGLPLIQPAGIGQALDQIAAHKPDVLVVVAYGQILPGPLLACSRLGAVNLHASLLPLLRGAAPINRAVIEGHQESGVSTMFMDEGLDTGDVIRQQATPLAAQETAGSLADRLAGMGAQLLLETLELLAAGRAPRTPQDHSRATYAPRLSKSEGLLDWGRPALELDRQVRGMDPWPAAFTKYKGQPLRLFAPTAVLPNQKGAAPGTLLDPSIGPPEHLVVACGEGALAVGQVQAAGKRRLPAGQFLRGARLASGAVLG